MVGDEPMAKFSCGVNRDVFRISIFSKSKSYIYIFVTVKLLRNGRIASLRKIARPIMLHLLLAFQHGEAVSPVSRDPAHRGASGNSRASILASTEQTENEPAEL